MIVNIENEEVEKYLINSVRETLWGKYSVLVEEERIKILRVEKNYISITIEPKGLGDHEEDKEPGDSGEVSKDAVSDLPAQRETNFI